jgi:methyltransferase (TIGR00027 family)
MRARRPSQTASFVALARALAHDGFTTLPHFSDPYARRLLSPGWTAAYRMMSRGLRRAAPARRERSIAQLDPIALRVSAIDAEIEAALAPDCRQVVILGAGLDTRALRMASLASVAVFEVDHPATQAYKQQKTSALRPLTRSLHFVPVDFERSLLTEKLADAGFHGDEPTVWVWEGVVMYLTDHALRGTLDEVARACASKSLLLLNYHVPSANSFDPETGIRRLLLSFWREPQIGIRTTDSMHEAVSRAGFVVEKDTRPSQWARSLGAREPSGHTADVSRLLVARRSPVA